MADPPSSSFASPPLARSAKTSSSVKTFRFFAVFVVPELSCPPPCFVDVAGGAAMGVAALAGIAAGVGAGAGATDCAPTPLPSAPANINPATAKLARQKFILLASLPTRLRIIITFPIGMILPQEIAVRGNNAIRLVIHESNFKPARSMRLPQHLRPIVERKQISLRPLEQPVVFLLDRNFRRRNIPRIRFPRQFLIAFLLQQTEFSAHRSEIAEKPLPRSVILHALDGIQQIFLPLHAARINSRSHAHRLKATPVAVIDISKIGTERTSVNRANTFNIVVGDHPVSPSPRRLRLRYGNVRRRRSGSKSRLLLRGRRERLVLSPRAGRSSAQQKRKN